MSLLVVPAPPAVAATVPDVPAPVVYTPTDTRAAERAARTLNRRVAPVQQVVVQRVVQVVAVKVVAVKAKPPVVKAKAAVKPAVRVVKPVVKKATPKPVPKAEAVTVTGRGAVAARFALAQVGKRYVWGSMGPNTWDCSGLSAGSWAKAGVTLPHQSGAQAHAGRAISRSQLQPGDLVIWSGHVALSLGGNRIVHAANSRVGVVVGTIYGTPIAYRRVG